MSENQRKFRFIPETKQLECENQHPIRLLQRKQNQSKKVGTQKVNYKCKEVSGLPGIPS